MMDQISWQHQSDEAAAAAAMVEESGPPPFLMKTFEMVDDLSTADIVYWNRGGHSFVVWDHNAFSTTLLPAYFKHNNFSSFVRQLNTYGFRKIDAEKWEFANEGFVRGEKHLLKNIRRRRSPTHHSPSPHPADVGPCVELGRFGQEAEVDRLRRDKQVLMTELVKLRQQNQNIRLHLQQVESGVHGTEKKQKKMMRFLVNAMQNPDIIRQLVRHKEMNKGSRAAGETNRNDKELNLLKVGHDGECGSEVSELEALAMQMQGMGKAKMEERCRDHRKIEQSDKEVVDEGFWGEMLNQGFNEAERLMGKNGEGEEEDDHVNVLANRFGFLGSTSSSNIS